MKTDFGRKQKKIFSKKQSHPKKHFGLKTQRFVSEEFSPFRRSKDHFEGERNKCLRLLEFVNVINNNNNNK